MSTVIYDAWRSKIGVNLFPTVVEEIRTATIPLVKKAIKKQYKLWENMPFVKHTLKLDRDPSKLDFSRCLKQLYGEQLVRAERSCFDLNLGFSVRYYKERYHIVPYMGDFYRLHGCNVIKAIDNLDCLEDYRYWNNTDEPEGMNYEEWKARGKIWDILDEKWKTNYLYLDVVTYDTLWSIDPAWEIK